MMASDSWLISNYDNTCSRPYFLSSAGGSPVSSGQHLSRPYSTAPCAGSQGAHRELNMSSSLQPRLLYGSRAGSASAALALTAPAAAASSINTAMAAVMVTPGCLARPGRVYEWRPTRVDPCDKKALSLLLLLSSMRVVRGGPTGSLTEVVAPAPLLLPSWSVSTISIKPATRKCVMITMPDSGEEVCAALSTASTTTTSSSVPAGSPWADYSKVSWGTLSHTINQQAEDNCGVAAAPEEAMEAAAVFSSKCDTEAPVTANKGSAESASAGAGAEEGGWFIGTQVVQDSAGESEQEGWSVEEEEEEAQVGQVVSLPTSTSLVASSHHLTPASSGSSGTSGDASRQVSMSADQVLAALGREFAPTPNPFAALSSLPQSAVGSAGASRQGSSGSSLALKASGVSLSTRCSDVSSEGSAGRSSSHGSKVGSKQVGEPCSTRRTEATSKASSRGSVSSSESSSMGVQELLAALQPEFAPTGNRFAALASLPQSPLVSRRASRSSSRRSSNSSASSRGSSGSSSSSSRLYKGAAVTFKWNLASDVFVTSPFLAYSQLAWEALRSSSRASSRQASGVCALPVVAAATSGGGEGLGSRASSTTATRQPSAATSAKGLTGRGSSSSSSSSGNSSRHVSMTADQLVAALGREFAPTPNPFAALASLPQSAAGSAGASRQSSSGSLVLGVSVGSRSSSGMSHVLDTAIASRQLSAATSAKGLTGRGNSSSSDGSCGNSSPQVSMTTSQLLAALGPEWAAGPNRFAALSSLPQSAGGSAGSSGQSTRQGSNSSGSLALEASGDFTSSSSGDSTRSTRGSDSDRMASGVIPWVVPVTLTGQQQLQQASGVGSISSQPSHSSTQGSSRSSSGRLSGISGACDQLQQQPEGDRDSGCGSSLASGIEQDSTSTSSRVLTMSDTPAVAAAAAAPASQPWGPFSPWSSFSSSSRSSKTSTTFAAAAAGMAGLVQQGDVSPLEGWEGGSDCWAAAAWPSRPSSTFSRLSSLSLTTVGSSRCNSISNSNLPVDGIEADAFKLQQQHQQQHQASMATPDGVAATSGSSGSSGRGQRSSSPDLLPPVATRSNSNSSDSLAWHNHNAGLASRSDSTLTEVEPQVPTVWTRAVDLAAGQVSPGVTHLVTPWGDGPLAAPGFMGEDQLGRSNQKNRKEKKGVKKVLHALGLTSLLEAGRSRAKEPSALAPSSGSSKKSGKSSMFGFSSKKSSKQQQDGDALLLPSSPNSKATDTAPSSSHSSGSGGSGGGSRELAGVVDQVGRSLGAAGAAVVGGAGAGCRRLAAASTRAVSRTGQLLGHGAAWVEGLWGDSVSAVKGVGEAAKGSMWGCFRPAAGLQPVM